MKLTKNLKALETMLFIWSSLRDREKLSDRVIIDLANSPEMRAAYEKDFNKESVRKVLSAINNRELLNQPTKKESRFWNYNMWMLEDADMTELMLTPIKMMNLDDVAKQVNLNLDDAEVVFFPGHMTTYKIIDNSLYINFFMLKADLYGDGPLTIEDKTVKSFIREKLTEIKQPDKNE